MRMAAALLPVALLGACATTGTQHAAAGPALQPGEAPYDRAARAAADREDVLSQMTFWAQEYQAHPTDLESAQKFVDALRHGGRADRAAQVAVEALEKHADDRGLVRSLGLSLLVAGKAQEALRPLALAASGDPHDWQVRSALGAALDQVNRPVEARQAYQEALALAPDQPDVLTNMGVSFLMTGDAPAAEDVLRKASALPGASAETRVNLAIAVALQGRFDEAERLQRIDLPPETVTANMLYLRGLQSDPRRWGELRQGRS